MEGIVNNLTQNLYEAFRGFILDVEFPEPDPNLTLNLEPNGVYLTFNYTDTLERYYGIDIRVRGESPVGRCGKRSVQIREITGPGKSLNTR
jgi:hypothetical protein